MGILQLKDFFFNIQKNYLIVKHIKVAEANSFPFEF